MARPFIGYGRQTIEEVDISAVVDVLKSDYLTQGPALEQFENALANKVGARHAIACANGTAALHLACLAAGLGPADVALVPTITFVATANAPLYCGAEILLADVSADSRSLTADSAAHFARSTDGAKAVLPVHYAGLATAMAEIRAATPGLTVIEDACHALGGTYEDGSPIGNCAHSDMAVFSFHPVKSITTGEGGAVTTNDDALAHRIRLYRNHGIERDAKNFVDGGDEKAAPWLYEQQVLGFNYRMTDIQAALGLAQLSRLDDFVARRRKVAAYLDDRLSGLNHVNLPHSRSDQRGRSGLHLYHMDIDFDALGCSRGKFMTNLRTAGIGTQVHYIPVHHQPFHHARIAASEGGFPCADKHYQQTLTIPLYPSILDEEVEHIAATLSGMLK